MIEVGQLTGRQRLLLIDGQISIHDQGYGIRFSIASGSIGGHEDGFATHTIRIADKILVDLDDDYELVGLWLLELPGGISVTV